MMGERQSRGFCGRRWAEISSDRGGFTSGRRVTSAPFFIHDSS